MKLAKEHEEECKGGNVDEFYLPAIPYVSAYVFYEVTIEMLIVTIFFLRL